MKKVTHIVAKVIAKTIHIVWAIKYQAQYTAKQFFKNNCSKK